MYLLQVEHVIPTHKSRMRDRGPAWWGVRTCQNCRIHATKWLQSSKHDSVRNAQIFANYKGAECEFTSEDGDAGDGARFRGIVVDWEASEGHYIVRATHLLSPSEPRRHGWLKPFGLFHGVDPSQLRIYGPVTPPQP